MVNKIVILGTGGTIAGVAKPGDHVGYDAAQLDIARLIDAVPGLAGQPIETEQVTQLDSKDMTHDVWRALALRVAHWLGQPDVAGIVITHGTDTLEETAWFLQAVLQPARPVVLTCAMRPATALMADGPQNILDAVVVAGTAGASGVLVVCAGAVHTARDVRKVHTYRVDAFGSGDAGPLGYVEQGVLRRVREWPAAGDADSGLLRTEAAQWPRVALVTSHAGADGRMVDLLVADGVRGIAVAATGNGTIHAEMAAALERAEAAGVAVVRATRCADGRVIAAPGAEFADAADLTPVKARISLMLSLAI